MQRQIFQCSGSVLDVVFVIVNIRMCQFHAFNINLTEEVQLSAKEETEHIIVSRFPERIKIFGSLTISHIFIPDILGNLTNIKLITINLSKGVELRNGFILSVIFQNVEDIFSLVRRNHFATEERVSALSFHFVKLRFCQILFGCSKRLEQRRKRIHQVFIRVLCAIVDHYLICMVHAVFFEVCERIHTERDSLLEGHFFQCSSINGIIQNRSELLNFGNSNRTQITFCTLRIIIVEVVVAIKQAFRVNPCNMLIPVVHKGNDICTGCTACGCTTQRTANHLGHKDRRNRRSCEEHCLGFRQINAFGQNVDVD